MNGLTIILPAHDEAKYLPGCLEALLASEPLHCDLELIVAANGCRDETVSVAEGFRDRIEAKGWALTVLDLAEGSKPGAMNAADRIARFSARVYLDADVLLSPPLLAQIVRALDRDDAVYASGQVNITAETSWFSQAYAVFYRQVPFFTQGVPGCGLFAVNQAGRERWGAFQQIISDDTYVRLQFSPDERIGLPGRYDWPVVDGLAALVRVRRRQDRGVREIAALYPELLARDDVRSSRVVALLKAAFLHPLGALAYVLVAVIVRATPGSDRGRWSRGR